jgi:hypothetical protein
MGIDAVGVVGGAVPHRQHAAACADGNGRFKDAPRRPRGSRSANGRLAEQLPLLELLANDAQHLLSAERVFGSRAVSVGRCHRVRGGVGRSRRGASARLGATRPCAAERALSTGSRLR